MAKVANHKILGRLSGILTPVRILANLLLLAGSLALFGFLQDSYAPDVFIGERIYFKDPDSYSRMTRVRMLMEDWKPVRQHDFENWPDGVKPHTTIPMDAVIAMGAGVSSVAGAGSRFDSLDLAGALASPVLGGILIVVLWAWGWRLGLPYRVPMLLVLAASPILIHGFLLGRPDHQSLQILLVGVAVALEVAAWKKPGRAIWIAGGLVWGLALWTSLYEPAILLMVVLAGRILGQRLDCFRRPAVWWWAGFAMPVVLFVLIDGVRIGDPASQFGPMFQRWAHQIGELSTVGPFSSLLYSWTGWLLPLVPILLLVTWRRSKQPEAALLFALLVVALAFTLWQARWGYFLAVIFAVSLPFALPAFGKAWIAWPVFIVSLWPIMGSWDAHFFPVPGEERRRLEMRQDAYLLRQIADQLAERGGGTGAILAPWWLSPALAYWSGLPTVAGSSHQSLPGIADAGRFYLADDWAEASRLIDRRKVRYVIAYEPDRIRFTSARLLDRQPPNNVVADRIYKVYDVPDWLERIHTDVFFKVYEVE